MSQTIRMGLALIALALTACEQGNKAPGALPPAGSYTSNVPGPGFAPCANGVGFCAIVPDPPGTPTKKDTPPKIEFPDFPAKTEFQALPGSSFTLLVTVTSADTATVSCTSGNATLTPTPPSGNYLMLLNSMPDKDVTCTITAGGPLGESSATIILKPTQKDVVIPLKVRNVPKYADATVNTAMTIGNFYIDGFDAKTTSVTASCTNDPKAQLIQNKNNLSWYNLKLTPMPAASGTCTITATRGSDNQNDSAIVTFIYEQGPAITPINFLPTAKLPFVKTILGYVAAADVAAPVKAPLFHVESKSVSVKCTDNHNAVLSIAEAVPLGAGTYKLYVVYKNSGAEAASDTCVITAIDNYEHLSELKVAMIHGGGFANPKIKNVPAEPVKSTGSPVEISNIGVDPSTNATQLGILCSKDKKATIVQKDATYTATIKPNLEVYTPTSTDNCNIFVVVNGVQTTFVPITVLTEAAQFTPLNYLVTKNDVEISPENGEEIVNNTYEEKFIYLHFVDGLYVAQNLPSTDPKATTPIVEITDPDGIKLVSIDWCSGPNVDFFDKAFSSIQQVTNTSKYRINIRYTALPNSGPDDACQIKAIDSVGQISYETITLKQ